MATESKTKAPTPVERVAELETQLSAAITMRDTFEASAKDLSEKFQKSQGDLTARTNELLTERREHSETKLTLQTVEAALASEKTAHAALQASFETKVQTKAAEIAASNGHAAAPAAPAAKPGAMQEAPDKLKMTANELIAADIKASIQR